MNQMSIYDIHISIDILDLILMKSLFCPFYCTTSHCIA